MAASGKSDDIRSWFRAASSPPATPLHASQHVSPSAAVMADGVFGLSNSAGKNWCFKNSAVQLLRGSKPYLSAVRADVARSAELPGAREKAFSDVLLAREHLPAGSRAQAALSERLPELLTAPPYVTGAQRNPSELIL